MTIWAKINDRDQILISDDGSNLTVSGINVTINGIEPSDPDFEKDLMRNLHINTLNGYDQILADEPVIESPMIHIKVDDEFNGKIEITFTANGELHRVGVSHDGDATYADSSRKHPRKMLSSDTSYEILRVNPKLTGNVKVVVDEKGNMYLDTFKTIPALSARKYRKIPVNPSEYYGRAVMTAFHGMTSDDFYGIPSSCYAVFSAANDYKDQYYDKYNCGVRTNDDEFYTENFSMLAPLCVKEIRPDFFLIFKVDDAVADLQSDAEKIKYFLSKGTLIKSFDMREGSNIGRYTRSIYEHAKDYSGDAYYSYNDENFNTYTGISLDRGVVTSAYESAKMIYMNCSSQVALNNWITEGFERNRLINKDMINFEFMFNDTEENLFSINRYFGIYVRLNSDGEYTCMSSDGSTYTFNEGTPSEFDPSLAPTVVYGFADKTSFTRTSTNISDASDKKLDAYISEGVNPNVNVARPNAFRVIDASSYISMTLRDTLKVGEHYRIIDRDALNVYDVIISNCGEDGELSDLTYNTYRFGDDVVNVQRISISKRSEGDVAKDVALLCNAIKMFDTNDFRLSVSNETSISIASSKDGMYFEKVCSIPGFTKEQMRILSTYSDDSILLFGTIEPRITYLSCDDAVEAEASNAIFYPMSAMAIGDRVAHITKFMSLEDCIEIDSVITDEMLNELLVYRTDAGYVPFEPMSIEFGIDGDQVTESFTVLSGDLTRSIIHVPGAVTRSDRFLLYNTNKITPGICSIFPIRDFVTDVIDNRESDAPRGGSQISLTPGEYATANNCFGIAVLGTTEEDFKDYVDTTNVIERGDTLVDFNANMIAALGKNAMATSPVTSQSICKWKFTGTDARCMDMRLMLKYSNALSSDPNDGYLNEKISSYFVVPNTDGEESDGTTWAIKAWDKMLMKKIGFISASDKTSGDVKYLSNSLSDIIYGEPSQSLRSYILNGTGSIDDLVYSEGNASNKYSKVYAQGDNAITFISGGVKVNLQSSNKTILDLSKYNGYNGILISADVNVSDHNMPYETIIDETEKKIAVIWYTGSPLIGGANATNNVAIKMMSDIPMSNYDVSGASIIIPYKGYGDRPKFRVMSVESSPSISGAYTNEDEIMFISCEPKYDTSLAAYVTGRSDVYMNGDKIDGSYGDVIERSSTSYYQKTDIYAVVEDASSMAEPGISAAFDEKSSIYVKTSRGTMDYSTINGLFAVSRTEPYMFRGTTPIESYYVTHGLTLPSYIEPVMRDMLAFEFDDTSIGDATGMNLSGCNIKVSNVATLPQLWIRKLIDQQTINSNLRDRDAAYMYADVLGNVSIMTDMWRNIIYNKYNYYNDEMTPVNGISVGYEQNMFLASRAINLNGLEGNSIDISSWMNTESGRGYIKLDVTGSITDYIFKSPGFVKSWGSYNGNSAASYKMRYIENSIMSNIDITNDVTFEFYNIDAYDAYMFIDYTDDMADKKMSNIKNELKSENGRYYMYVYPTVPGTYSAKMTIQL